MHAEHADSDRLNDLSGHVIGCALTVINTLGAGFLEKVYENALAYELRAGGFAVAQQCSVMVRYNDVVVGEYFADLLVENVLLVELKCVKALGDAHRMQCTNYLRATGLRLCLLLNFGRSRLEIRRVVSMACERAGGGSGHSQASTALMPWLLARGRGKSSMPRSGGRSIRRRA